MEFLEKIRSKPRKTKVRIFWLVFLIGAVLVIYIWFLSLNQSMPAVVQETDKLTGNEKLNQLKNETKSLWGAIRAQAGEFFKKTDDQ